MSPKVDRGLGTNTHPPVQPEPVLSAKDQRLFKHLASSLIEVERMLAPPTPRGPLSTSAAQPVDPTLSAVHRQVEIIRRTLEESLLQSWLNQRPVEPELSRVDLLRIVREVRDTVQQVSRTEGKPLVLEVREPALVMASPRLIRRVVESMLDCSMQHLMPGQSLMIYVEQDASLCTLHMVGRGCATSSGCPCELVRQPGLDIRLAFCRRAAWMQWGWLNLEPGPVHSGLDLSLSLHRATVQDAGERTGSVPGVRAIGPSLTPPDDDSL